MRGEVNSRLRNVTCLRNTSTWI